MHLLSHSVRSWIIFYVSQWHYPVLTPCFQNPSIPVWTIVSDETPQHSWIENFVRFTNCWVNRFVCITILKSYPVILRLSSLDLESPALAASSIFLLQPPIPGINLAKQKSRTWLGLKCLQAQNVGIEPGDSCKISYLKALLQSTLMTMI